jgi:small subunit ribosomal protein S13
MVQDKLQQNKDFRHIVRVANTDLDGSKPIVHALRKIKGISFMFSNAVCILTGVDKKKITGQMSDADVQKLDRFLADPLGQGCPEWLINRRHDFETGVNKHLIGADLTYQRENDIKLMRKIRSYKGVRHAFGLTVRGQRTKSNFRKNKGKASLGVQKKKTVAGAPAPAPAPAKADKGGKK